MCTEVIRENAGIRVIDLGRKDYDEALEIQRGIFAEMINTRRNGLAVENEIVLLAEHNPVVTLGRYAKEMNVLASQSMLKSRGAILRRTDRGGDVTFHGPGQLVAYPLLSLEKHRLGVKDYVNLLEEAIINTIGLWGIKGKRVEGASGVWIGKGTRNERKICAIGVKCSRFCTMHGLALNVNTDLNWFRLINPCGFTDKGVTSMQAEIGSEIEMSEVKRVFSAKLLELLNA